MGKVVRSRSASPLDASVAPDLCVVHLARHSNGLDPYERFLGSYRRHSASAPHELAIVLKGFGDERASKPYRELAADICQHWLEVPDDSLDLGAYKLAALSLAHRQLVFANSFSVICDDGWLRIMSSAANSERVGAVGATGSWASQASYLRFELALGGPYRRVFADRVATIRTLASLSPNQPVPVPVRGPVRGAVFGGRALAKHAISFASFPCPHLRTNCFLIDRDLWLRLCSTVPTDKDAAYRFESGRRGMTARLKAMGLRVLVAGRDGRGYDSSEWPASGTFWQGNQENLLVEDNQTRAYQHGDPAVRRALSGFAWGELAAPDVACLPEVA
jgi:hypothetical protein